MSFLHWLCGRLALMALAITASFLTLGDEQWRVSMALFWPLLCVWILSGAASRETATRQPFRPAEEMETISRQLAESKR